MHHNVFGDADLHHLAVAYDGNSITDSDRIASIEGTLELRRQQLQAAIESGSDRVDAFRRTVDGLEANIGAIRAEAEALAAQGPTIVMIGIGITASPDVSRS